jgi:hypothetical protein
MEIKVDCDLNRILSNDKMKMTKYSNETGIVVITIPEKLTNTREVAIGAALHLLKRNNPHLKITAMGFTPIQNGHFECFLSLEEKSFV